MKHRPTADEAGVGARRTGSRCRARRALGLGLGIALALVPAALPRDEGGESREESLADDAYRDSYQRAQTMADACLAYLAASLRSRGDGSFERHGAGKDPTVAKCALGALAFMAAGNTVDNGTYAPELRSAIRWLLSRTKPVECTCHMLEGAHLWASVFEPSDTLSRMHGHGYATWALALAYGMTFGARNEHERQEIREKLDAAVHCIELAQTESGGWGYEYTRGTFHEGSVTITQLQALRAAHEAGVRVSASVIQKAVEYVRNSQIKTGPKEGGFRYRLGDPTTSFALTAAAVSALNQTGIYDSDNIDLGIEYMRRTDPLTNYTSDSQHTWYARLYAVQAYWQFRELRFFRSYYPELVDQLERERSPDGSFFSDEYGDAYATAMAALALSVPFGYLPSFQR